MDIIAAIESTIGAVEGAISDTASIGGLISSIGHTVISVLGNIFNVISRIISTSFFLEVIGLIVVIGVFFKKFFDFVFTLLKFLFYQFPIWFFGLPKWPGDLFTPQKGDQYIEVGFIPFVIRYIMVIAISISKLPKCFLWYALDTMGWIIYLPFRFVFWVLDFLIPEMKITEKEHKGWDFLDEIDYFLHGPNGNWFIDQYADKSPPNPDPDSLNLEFHVIHFPNSVMETCYSISPYSLKKCDGLTDVVNAFTDMISSATLPFRNIALYNIIMAKKCLPGVICIENMTLAVLIFLLIVVGYMYYVFIVKVRSEKISQYDSSSVVVIPPPVIGGGIATRNMPNVLLDPYGPPLRTDGMYFPSDSGDIRGIPLARPIMIPSPGIPVNIETRGLNQDYTQMGILTRDKDDLILTLMGRRLITGLDKWQYYTISNTGLMNTKLPISVRGKSCSGEYGCDPLMSGDIVFVEGYKDTFKATIYENGKFSYIPYI